MNEKPNHAGQILRIKLQNFMSYDSIEVYPGCNLNLIIGPNGTGKSSILCAVLLGLNGKLKTLGRAEQLSSYVKSGCDLCCIEIELYEPNGVNVIIERKIWSTNKSEFTINGNITTLAKIAEVRKKYNIQIDNLCTFLPQEKVQDFAKLNPQQLLDQTQRTVGNGDLVQLHDELKRLQLATENQEKHNQQLQSQIDNEKQKNERLSDKVKSFKEKQSLCARLQLLNQKKAWLLYQAEVDRRKEIDNDTNLVKKSFNETKQKLDKCTKELKLFESNLSSYQVKLNEAKKNEAGKNSVMEDRLKRAEHWVDELEDLRNNTQSKIKEEENKKKELLKCRENVEKLTNDLNTLDATTGSEAELQEQREEVDKQLKGLHEDEVVLNKKKLDLEEDEETLKQEARNTKAECQNLKKRRDFRLEFIKKQEPDLYKSMQWLDKNRHLFQSHVYNPMLLELDVPNSKMAKFVENRINYRDLMSFTCTNPDDLNLLIQKLRTEQKLRVNVVCSDEYENTQYTPDIPISDLRKFGFYAYLSDLITGPEDILRFLCKTYKIHCVPVGDEKVKIYSGKLPKSISRFYSDNHVFIVKYSAYSGDKSISVQKLNDPRFFIESLDEKKLKILMDREKEVEVKINKVLKSISDVKEQLDLLRSRLEEVKEKKKSLGTRAEERQQIQIKLKRAMINYNSKKNSLKDISEIQEEANKQRQEFMKKIRSNLDDLKLACDESQKALLTRQKCEIRLKISNLGKKQILENELKYREELSSKEKMLREMEERQRAAERKCQQMKEKAKQLTDNISIGERAFLKFQKAFEQLPDELDQIETEIQETQARADFLQGGNFQVLQEYEERENQISQLTADLSKCKESLEERKLGLITKRDQWLNPVMELVSNINENFGKFFEAMDCAGEVSLVSGDNPNDFDQYGIKILVKFRHGVPLQELSGHFQSGGERAVATAIFMLSLQELTSVPFRFVDEINQGMDLVNEKRILQLIIHATSPKQSSQYFFITPKLLTDVECSETMTVLCIYSGPFAVSCTEWDIKKFLDRKTKEGNDD